MTKEEILTRLKSAEEIEHAKDKMHAAKNYHIGFGVALLLLGVKAFGLFDISWLTALVLAFIIIAIGSISSSLDGHLNAYQLERELDRREKNYTIDFKKVENMQKHIDQLSDRTHVLKRQFEDSILLNEYMVKTNKYATNIENDYEDIFKTILDYLSDKDEISKNSWEPLGGRNERIEKLLEDDREEKDYRKEFRLLGYKDGYMAYEQINYRDTETSAQLHRAFHNLVSFDLKLIDGFSSEDWKEKISSRLEEIKIREERRKNK